MTAPYLGAAAGFLLGQAGQRSPEEWLQSATLLLTRGIEVIGALVIAVGVLRALADWLAQHLPGARRRVSIETIRLGLGRSLGLALEFLLAADILATAVAPTWEAIGKLAAVATIRTALNYFLGKELEREAQYQGSPPDADAPTGTVVGDSLPMRPATIAQPRPTSGDPAAAVPSSPGAGNADT